MYCDSLAQNYTTAFDNKSYTWIGGHLMAPVNTESDATHAYVHMCVHVSYIQTEDSTQVSAEVY